MYKLKQSCMVSSPEQPLTGAALAKRVRELSHLSRREKAKACGYYTVTWDGHERAAMSEFLNALLDAEGIDPEGQQARLRPGRGREPSYRVRVQTNGTLVLSSAYSKRMGLQAGERKGNNARGHSQQHLLGIYFPIFEGQSFHTPELAGVMRHSDRGPVPLLR